MAGYFKLKDLEDWAYDFYRSEKKECYSLVCDAFASIPNTDFEIDLEIKNLGKLLALLSDREIKEIHESYAKEKKAYLDKVVCKDYDTKAKKIKDALMKLLSKGVKEDYIRDTGRSGDDFREAINYLHQMINDSDPRRKCKHNALSEFRRGADIPYSPSYDVDGLSVHKNSKPRELFPKIDKIIEIDKEYRKIEAMLAACYEIEASELQESVFPETIKQINEISRKLSDKEMKLLDLKQKKLAELDAEIEKIRKAEAERQLEMDTALADKQLSGDYINRRTLAQTKKQERGKNTQLVSDKHNKTWQDARDKFDSGSIFRRMFTALRGKHCKSIEDTLSVNDGKEVRR